jgi:ERF superfamily
MLTKSDSIAQLAAALARARMKFGALGKDREAKIASKSGASYSYDYADLADTNAAVMAALNAEAIAVFQPVSLDGAHAIVTTLLAHESGEWIASTLGLPIADQHDARAIGSALTYARRYSLQGMVAIAPKDEDDDAATARGGDHEQAKPTGPAPRPRCPDCGQPTLYQHGKTGAWFCSRREGGCGKGWPAGPVPTATRDVPDERAKLLEQLREVADGQDLAPAERRKLWARYCGPDTTPDDVDVAALADLVAALRAR